MHRTCRIVGIPSPGPRAMVGSKEEANESQSFAAACYVHNLFRGGKTRTRGPLLARIQGFNETSEGHRGGDAHLCPLEDLRAANIEI